MRKQPAESCVGLLADGSCKQHETGAGHPEAPERYDAIVSALEKQDLIKLCRRLDSVPATTGQLETVHPKRYQDQVANEVAMGVHELSTGDTPLSPGSFVAACQATGQAIRGVEAVMNGEVERAFCLTRPPGHHASTEQGMGFCLFNHVAVAARIAQQVHGVGKVLITDWDVHHGNGTQDIFYDDESVFYFSTHQHPWYPGTGFAAETGTGKGLGTTLNAPLPAHTSGRTVLDATEQMLTSAMERYKPELVLISAGFDSRINDPLGDFMLSDGDFAYLTQFMRHLANTHAEGRLVSLLEGGYNLVGLGLAASAHLDALLQEG